MTWDFLLFFYHKWIGTLTAELYVNLLAHIQYENQITDKVKADLEIQVVLYKLE